ncbi:hypothetical protein GQ43DRAFT_73184 [Delitschia confertaspora ATCC 74209]|uniref:Uncharacterized protein n=1 Tax=Delitschia confertaspora ATCC 74209 TaxID=1513339 RepID=A0A9P4JNN8_9PLEO|nr:hypothetical protein GQ43DRAFT_73184 [Delitschia confertaspora ATCC 74209]
MEQPRSSSHSSRRSYPNLHNLSLAPLSSKYPLDASSPPSPSESHLGITHTSYIQLRSAPSTPGILGLSHTRSDSRNGGRRSQKSTYAHEGFFVNPDVPVRDIGDIPKAKSTDTLLPSGNSKDRTYVKQGTKITGFMPLQTPPIRHHTVENGDEWLHRAGLAIAGETRESKGQSWLVRRESSTSLVHQPDGPEDHDSHQIALLSGEHFTDDEYSPLTPRLSRMGSRIGSRVHSRVPSAMNSRRGSRAGSRADLLMSVGQKSLISETEEDFGTMVEPDFVEADEEADGDEEEVARLASQQGFGLGNWMDKLIGWTLFSVKEDGEESDDEEGSLHDTFGTPEAMTKEELQLKKEVEAKRKKMEREAIIAASAAKSDHKTQGGEAIEPPPSEDGNGWQDAAWLLSVASKVLL